jgi:hypothetical protein
MHLLRRRQIFEQCHLTFQIESTHLERRVRKSSQLSSGRDNVRNSRLPPRSNKEKNCALNSRFASHFSNEAYSFIYVKYCPKCFRCTKPQREKTCRIPFGSVGRV